ncbi:glycoside hydrolase family 20 zincin-like fold domain-containing protein [Alistipes shahii]|uniref:glycoside hydrolase family 20 zincin-like fold domain-containing protein n=1 Tax=Alistipes shahii TaxID=328814 RepID=UPI003AF453E3
MKKLLPTLVLFATGSLCLSAKNYTLDVATTSISLRGGSAQGVFYGLQSLRQLIVAGRGTK